MEETLTNITTTAPEGVQLRGAPEAAPWTPLEWDSDQASGAAAGMALFGAISFVLGAVVGALLI
ncbi:hypothetical protein BH24ACT26_BH24ACT26_12600 [soil metagenome]